MKTVGIITMHRVQNCGSALQAYALQRIIESMGFKAELIDYIYPNKYHRQIAALREKKRRTWLARLANHVYSRFNAYLLSGKFDMFYTQFFHLSPEKYNTKEAIHSNPPCYDFYVAGSDQIWNPTYIGSDTTFMLSFVKDSPRIAYSSSIANKIIPDTYKEAYVNELSQFKAISVREELSCSLIQQLTGRQVDYVLDPALLLEPSQWIDIIQTASVQIKEKYILVYVLGYSFPVYDYAASIIRHVYEQTGMKVVVLVFSRANRNKLCKYVSVNDVHPANFLSLIKNASAVVTDSFHATALSLSFQRPLYALIKDKNYSDNRLYSLLKSVGAEQRAIEKNRPLFELPDIKMDYNDINLQLSKLRELSMNFLKDNLCNKKN